MLRKKETSGSLKIVFTFTAVLAIILAITSCISPKHQTTISGNYSNLPDPAPPFAPAKTGRQDVVLEAFSVSNRKGRSRPEPTLVSGNKRISINGLRPSGSFLSSSTIILRVNDRCAVNLQFWGLIRGVGYGYPFKAETESEVTFDKENNSITFKRNYNLPDHNSATYTHKLKPAGKGKVSLNWNLGISPETCGKLANKIDFHPEFSLSSLFCNLGVSVDGEKLSLSPVEAIKALPANKNGIRFKRLKVFKNAKSLTVAPKDPAKGFILKFDGKSNLTISEQYYQDKYRLGCTLSQPKGDYSTGSIIFDLGEVTLKSAKAPEPLAGIDFWARDRLHVPAPSTKNYMPNPSFEQGERYWTWWTAGGNQYKPSKPPCYEIVDDAKFGHKALRTNGTCGNHPLMSFPIPITKGKTYTLSFYAKADKPTQFMLGLSSMLVGDYWPKAFKQHWQADKNWKRYNYTFKATYPAFQLFFRGCGVTLDGIQVEEGPKTTAFTAPVIEGILSTADKDNSLQPGQDINACLELSGKANLSGRITVSLFNFYRKKLFDKTFNFKLNNKGLGKIDLPFDEKILGKGVFIIRADYKITAKQTITDYYRMSIMNFHDKSHATNELFGNSLAALRVTRGKEQAKHFVQWGWGSRTGSFSDLNNTLFDIPHYCASVDCLLNKDQHKALWGKNFKDYVYRNSPKFNILLDEICTPEKLKLVEQICYDIAQKYPNQKYWAFSGEADGRSARMRAGDYSGYAKVIIAMYKGIKRANPNAVVLPDQGPAHGIKYLEGLLKATHGKVKWDAVAIHPYIYPDEVDDMTADLIKMMAEYGYGKETPILFTEAGCINDVHIPEWGEKGNYDTFRAVRPSYDTGWREFFKAAWDARLYLTALKYWPQAQFLTIWSGNIFMDLNFAPQMVCKMVNTLGHLFGDPEFVADIKPVEDIKGYVFKDDQDRGLAAIWSTGKGGDVDRGLETGPKLKVKFNSFTPEFIDLMGNSYQPQPVAGYYTIPLSPAPLFIRGPKGSADELAQILNNADVLGSGDLVRVDILPTLEGKLLATLSNKTVKKQQGKLLIGKHEYPFSIPASDSITIPVSQEFPTETGQMQHWTKQAHLVLNNGTTSNISYQLAWFYVPQTQSPLPMDPNAKVWEKIPAIPLSNWYLSKKQDSNQKVKGGYPGDMTASYQLAWDKDNIYLRIEAKDDNFILTDNGNWDIKNKDTRQRLWRNDGCVEVYFDGFANARSNIKRGYDQDDFRYDFYAGNGMATDGAGSIWRVYKVFHQLAGGITQPNNDDCASGQDLKCEFRRKGNEFSYVMRMPLHYVMPIELRPGYRAGFGLYIHDKEPDHGKFPKKGLSLSLKPGEHCNFLPHWWPIMILSNKK